MYRVNCWVFISCPTFILLGYYLICVKLQLREYLQVKKLESKWIPAYGLLEFY
jgi:hypothetical protein